MLDEYASLFIQNVIFHCIVELTAATFLFVPIYPLKKHVGRRGIGCFGVALVIALLECIIFDVPTSLSLEVPNYIIFLIVGACFVRYCAKVSYTQIIFCVLCGITTQHAATALRFLMRILLLELKIPVNIIFYSLSLNFFQVAVVYFIIYKLVVKKLIRYGRSNYSKNNSMLATFVLLPVIIVLSTASKMFSARYENHLLFASFQLFVLISCTYILWMLVYQSKLMASLHDLNEKEAIIEKQRHQFAQSKNNIDNINRKCHDLKHQISAMKQMTNDLARDAYIKEMEESLLMYDAFIKTGNEAVDVVLTEKNLYCKENDIALACVVDGKLLEMIDIIDLYTILGNALDNAIECVMKIPDADKRYISLKAFSYQQFLEIQMENFCMDFPELVDGIPLTTKEDKGEHGYGIKSISMAVEKYSGCMTISQKDEMFCLQILIPFSESHE